MGARLLRGRKCYTITHRDQNGDKWACTIGNFRRIAREARLLLRTGATDVRLYAGDLYLTNKRRLPVPRAWRKI
jgi:hypothetical protein